MDNIIKNLDSHIYTYFLPGNLGGKLRSPIFGFEGMVVNEETIFLLNIVVLEMLLLPDEEGRETNVTSGFKFGF